MDLSIYRENTSVGKIHCNLLMEIFVSIFFYIYHFSSSDVFIKE